MIFIILQLLLKNSGKIKSKIKSAAEALNIQHYQLQKLTGTRFVGHRRAAFKCLLDTWPAMKLAFENIITDPKTRQETKAKVKGLLKKLNLYHFMSLVTCYLDILEIVTPISKLFEVEHLLPFEVQPLVSETIANIDNCINASIDHDLLVSYLASFRLMDGELNSSFLKADDRARSNSDCEHVSIAFENMTDLDETVVRETIAKKQNALRSLKVIFEERFSSFSDPVYQNMKWLDPKNWEDVAYGSNQIEKLVSHFKDPLEKANFDRHVVHKEWCQLKNFARSHHSGLDAHSLWEKILIYRRNEFKNVCLVAEIVFSLSTSNSMVERAFSLLTLLLSDKQLSLKHETIKSLMKINLSDKIWKEKEKNEILERAVDAYLSKR